jgi:hypothetical protein
MRKGRNGFFLDSDSNAHTFHGAVYAAFFDAVKPFRTAWAGPERWRK